MTIIISAVTAHVYREIVYNFFIPYFGDDEVIFQDDMSPRYITKEIENFPRERHIKSMS